MYFTKIIELNCKEFQDVFSFKINMKMWKRSFWKIRSYNTIFYLEIEEQKNKKVQII